MLPTKTPQEKHIKNADSADQRTNKKRQQETPNQNPFNHSQILHKSYHTLLRQKSQLRCVILSAAKNLYEESDSSLRSE